MITSFTSNSLGFVELQSQRGSCYFRRYTYMYSHPDLVPYTCPLAEASRFILICVAHTIVEPQSPMFIRHPRRRYRVYTFYMFKCQQNWRKKQVFSVLKEDRCLDFGWASLAKFSCCYVLRSGIECFLNGSRFNILLAAIVGSPAESFKPPGCFRATYSRR